MIVIQTTLDRRAMTTLARAERRSRRRSGAVRRMACAVAGVELALTVLLIRAQTDGWLVNLSLALLLLACMLGEDRVNGALALRRIPPDSREINTTFKNESCYVCRARSGESWHLYSQISAVVETKDYFALVRTKARGQIYDKNGFSWGTPEDFRDFIRKKTGLKIQYMK